MFQILVQLTASDKLNGSLRRGYAYSTRVRAHWQVRPNVATISQLNASTPSSDSCSRLNLDPTGSNAYAAHQQLPQPPKQNSSTSCAVENVSSRPLFFIHAVVISSAWCSVSPGLLFRNSVDLAQNSSMVTNCSSILLLIWGRC